MLWANALRRHYELIHEPGVEPEESGVLEFGADEDLKLAENVLLKRRAVPYNGHVQYCFGEIPMAIALTMLENTLSHCGLMIANCECGTGAALKSAIPNPKSEITRHPPKPRLAFRVGVVGHRPNRLQSADPLRLKSQLTDILVAVRNETQAFLSARRDLFLDGAPVLRAISPLAEGTDRLFAEAALDLDYELCCPMPFAQEEFEKDFVAPHALEPDSLAHFRGLLERAENERRLTRFELDGTRLDQGDAYGTCGRVVVSQSDLMVVVWDGEHLGKPGGTEETFAEARRMSVPVVWVDAQSPHTWQLIKASTPLPTPPKGQRATPAAVDTIESLRCVVRETLEPPRASAPEETSSYEDRTGSRITVRDFYREQKPRLNPAPLWRFFRDLVGDGHLSFQGFNVPDFEREIEKEWPRDESSAVARIVNRLRPFYAWPDKLAVLYSDIYRSTFILTYLLAAAAVGMALLPLAAAWDSGGHLGNETSSIVVELVMILVMLIIVFQGRRRAWHERWLDYRLVAELVRHLRLVVPLGGGRPFPQVPAHWATYGHPGATWMAWYVRAVERDIGLPSAAVNEVHVKACLTHLTELLAGQADYHRRNTSRCHRIEQRLHLWQEILLGLTLLGCGAHIVPRFAFSIVPPAWMSWKLTFLCGFLPALGAALAGINNQGEFRRIARRSEAMERRLGELLRIATSLGDRPTSRQVVAISTEAAQLMVNEVLDWRVVFLDRPLKTPA